MALTTTYGSAHHAPSRASIWLLAGLILLCLAVGWAGSLVTRTQIPTWYAALDKPSWTPPSWLFGPVWTTLYVLIGTAGWRVAPRTSSAHRAWPHWWIQLVLNGIWTPLFFGAHQVASALIVLVMLVLSILMFIRLTWSHDRVASLLLVPYLAWTSFATTLNAGILWLN
jgi:tryptophan-rich sensory protein